MADLHDSTEHYLAAIYEIEEENIEIKRARIAERLNISAPSVTEHIHRMEKNGLVAVANNNSVFLTQEGREKAASVVRRHRLAERLLVDVIGIDWAKAHDEADRWEHVISDEVEKHLLVLLNNPQTCPHGNPIPMADGSMIDSEQRLSEKLAPLTTIEGQGTVTIRSIGEFIELDTESLQFVSDNKMFPGQTALILKITDDGVVIETDDGKTVVVPPPIGNSIFVEVN